MSEVSSAYRKILCSLLLIIIPISMFCFMRIARIFAHIRISMGYWDPMCTSSFDFEMF